jgi:hypothetical protein
MINTEIFQLPIQPCTFNFGELAVVEEEVHQIQLLVDNLSEVLGVVVEKLLVVPVVPASSSSLINYKE